jgi:hypothetical protein
LPHPIDGLPRIQAKTKPRPGKDQANTQEQHALPARQLVTLQNSKRRRHLYLFHIEPWGACQIDSNTSGKHGFGLPKLFRITSRDGTLRFKNRAQHGFAVSERSNSELIRVAISQFCAWTGNHDHHFEDELDTSFARYTGEVSNRHGRVLSETSLLPRDRHRADDAG